MKKHRLKVKKLALKKETLTSLQEVTGGSEYQQTVIRYWETDYCTASCTDCSPVYS